MTESRGTQVCAEAFRKMKEVRSPAFFKFRAQSLKAKTRSYTAEALGEITVSLQRQFADHCCRGDE